jgi:hypothetical protein
MHKKYFVHILNWEIFADTPEAAAKEVAQMLIADPEAGLILQVTDKPVDVIPATEPETNWHDTISEVRAEGFGILEVFDSADFDLPEDNGQEPESLSTEELIEGFAGLNLSDQDENGNNRCGSWGEGDQ